MEQVKQRKDWIDWSKAILIWLMVLGHCRLPGDIRSFVYAFHMPAFFIISGYLYKPHSWRNTLKSLGIPVLFFSFVSLAFLLTKMAFTGHDIDFIQLLINVTPPYWKCSSGEDITLFTGIWFIVVLFFLRLVSGDIKMFSFVRRRYKYILPVLLAYMAMEPLFISYIEPVQDYYTYKVIACLPFMMVGFYLKDYGDTLLALECKWLIVLAAAYVGLTLCNVGNIDCGRMISEGITWCSLSMQWLHRCCYSIFARKSRAIALL